MKVDKENLCEITFLKDRDLDHLPKMLEVEEWQTGSKNLPKKSSGTYLVLCESKDTKERKLAFAYYNVERFKGVKIDYDNWNIFLLYDKVYSRGSESNYWNVVAWAKLKGVK